MNVQQAQVDQQAPVEQVEQDQQDQVQLEMDQQPVFEWFDYNWQTGEFTRINNPKMCFYNTQQYVPVENVENI